MNDKLTDEQNAAILKALNKAIEEGPWEETNFLKALGKSLVGIRDKFLAELEEGTPSAQRAERNLANQLALRSNQQKVFISLYSSDGVNLQAWERIVANLPHQSISRPIYANEVDVKEAIKMKDNKMNEAYVAIYVNKTELLNLPPDKIPVDKLGKSLLTLKDRALSLDNVSYFVHISGTYELNKGRLNRKP